MPPFSSFQNRRMNLIKKVNALSTQTLHTNAHVWQQKSLFQSLAEDWRRLSGLGESLPMIDSSIFTGAIRQKKAEKKKEREAIDAHRAEHARRPAVNRRDKKKKKKKKKNKIKHLKDKRLSDTDSHLCSDPRRPVIGLVYNCQLGFYLPCRRFNNHPYVV